MYAPFFGLNKEPFSIAPDPRFLFMSDMHREALAHLLYGVGGGGGFVLLTGEIGAGKTTVCRALLEQVPPNVVVAYIFNPKLTAYELLQTVCEEFGITVQPASGAGDAEPTLKDHVDALNRFLLAAHAAGRQAVLIIDEAQSLEPDVLEQLRLLTNLETGERKLLQIVLIGQPELRDMLAKPRLEQLAQRVIARYHLKALSPAETVHYIQHRLAVAGPGSAAVQKLFDADAVVRIHALTGGVPRRINLLCDRAMLGAYAHGQPRVNRATVEKAAREVFFFPAGGGRKEGTGRTAADTARSSATAQAARAPSPPWAWVAGAVVVTALVVGGSMLAWRGHAKPAPAAAASPPAVAASAATPAAAAPAGASAAIAPAVLPAAAARSDAGTVLAFAHRDEAAAWRELAKWWNAEWADNASCAQTGAAGLACLRGSGGLAVLRTVGRPSLLLLRDDVGGTAWIQLVAIGDADVTLRAGNRRFQVSQPDLARIWRGEFATLWRPPPGWREGTDPTSRPELREWINQRLAEAGEADTKKPLKDRLAAFQLGQGMAPDGQPTPVTLLRLARPDPKFADPRLPVEPAAGAAPT
jgi:general secretion pathway protein A